MLRNCTLVVSLLFQYPNPPKRTGPKMSPKDIKLVVDTMLQGLGKQLRSCGADVRILDTDKHHYDAIKVSKQLVCNSLVMLVLVLPRRRQSYFNFRSTF